MDIVLRVHKEWATKCMCNHFGLSSHLKFAVPDPMDMLLRNDQVVKVVWGNGEPRIAYLVLTMIDNS